MTNGKKRLSRTIIMWMAALLWCLPTTAQTHDTKVAEDSPAAIGTEKLAVADTIRLDSLDMQLGKIKQKRDWATWRPNSTRALWLALVLPGAGQIYNRKYWKLPIVYGGFVGCAYAMRWNNQMYHDYSQAYMDLMDDDPNTESYNQFMHLGAQINDSNRSRYETLFQKRKDRFRRWRDMSFFVMVGVYALSVVDAYVDASLSEFDISDDLSLHVAPTLMNSRSDNTSFRTTALGMQCSLNF